MEQFQLIILLTTAGAAVGAVLIKALVSAAKAIGFLPETGRSSMYAAGAIAAVLIALAVFDAPLLRDGVSGQDIFVIFLSWFGLYTAAVGVHETAVKGQRIIQGTTNTTGPDRQ